MSLNAPLANALIEVANAEHRAAAQASRVACLSSAADPGFEQSLALRQFVDEHSVYGELYTDRRATGLTIGRLAARSSEATQLAFGYADSLVIGSAYEHLTRLFDDHELVKLLMRGHCRQAEQAGRYHKLAEKALVSPGAQTYARFLIDHSWTPFGSQRESTSSAALAIRTMFEPRASTKTVGAIDRRIASLPGLQGLTVMRDRVTAAFGYRRLGRKSALLNRISKNW